MVQRDGHQRGSYFLECLGSASTVGGNGGRSCAWEFPAEKLAAHVIPVTFKVKTTLTDNFNFHVR